MQIRSFQPRDAEKIARLFGRHLPYQRDAAFWLWLNRTLPDRPSLVAVAEHGGEVVGHYGILPVELRLPDGKTIWAGHGLHAFVSPEYRGEVSIFQISAHAYALARAAGLELVFGFPNAGYRLIQEKLEGWRCISSFKAWTKTSAARSAAEDSSLEPADLTDDGQLHAAIGLWETRALAPTGICIHGQSRWWMARFLAHPQRPYSFHWYCRGGERRGLVVAKVFNAEGESRAHIIDYVTAPGEHLSGLLSAFEAAFGDRVQRYVHWPVEADFRAALEQAHYRPDGFETYFGARNLARPSGPEASAGALWDPAAWRLSPSLSDAF